MAVNIDGDGLIALSGTSSTQGRVRLAEDSDNGTNFIELTAPASVGSDRVITFPDATTTMVGTDATQTLTNKTLTTPNINSAQVDTVSGTAPLYFARAWVNFNGTGTVAIRESGNVSSITDNGTGDYTVNFTTAMPDANYAPYLVSSSNGVLYIPNPCLFINNSTNVIVAPTTSAYRTAFRDAGNAVVDPTHVCTGVFR
jgi:hypothetical protein